MPIILPIARRSRKTRALLGGFYLVLSLGAVTMVYPFLLMLAGTTKSSVDTPDAVPVPLFLFDDAALYRKDLEGFLNESIDVAQQALRLEAPSFREVVPPREANARLVEVWQGFIEGRDFPFYYSELSYIAVAGSRGAMPSNLRRFKRGLEKEFGEDIERMNAGLGSDFAGWNNVIVPPETSLQAGVRLSAVPGRYRERFRAFRATRPMEERYFFSVIGYYTQSYLKTAYLGSIEGYNAAHGTDYRAWADIRLPQTCPAGGRERADWLEFARAYLSPLWVRADAAARPSFEAYLKARYRGIAELNKIHGAAYRDFAAVPMFDGNLPSDAVFSDFLGFVQGWTEPGSDKTHQLAPEHLLLAGADFDFREHLRARFGTIERLNTELGCAVTSFDDVIAPQRDAHWLGFAKRRSALKLEFCTRNFIAVTSYLLLHGRALFNTVLYCAMAILAALTFNPLAAYALSRYRPPSSYKILLMLMLTMAFPPMVTQIPAFLLLRRLHLLNTYWALILPGLANGYAIFMLKGFFDSLPKELYESAELDGAGEFRIFWTITMSLSKPILAVISLGAFIGAYSNFMMALLICQDQRMWTIMPWLYQLQASSSQGVVFAALVLAALPTLLIYALCQNVIMRGIVVPVEK